MNLYEEIEKNPKKITLTKRPIPLSVDYRPMYKITMILLVLKLNCTKSKSTLFKIHFLVWFIKSKEHMLLLYKHIDSKNIINVTNWSIEPSVIRAIRIMIAENLISKDNDKYILSDIGESFINKILDDKDIFKQEKDFLKSIGKQMITDAKIEKMLKEIRV
jgi:hypothetical protein